MMESMSGAAAIRSDAGGLRTTIADARFLYEAGEGRTIRVLAADSLVFAQGDEARGLCYILKGRVKAAVVSNRGRERVIAIFSAGDFFGEQWLAGHGLRLSTATTLTGSSIMELDKGTVLDMLRTEHAFANLLLKYMLTRTIRVEEDLKDHLFNSSERRLARALLLLAGGGEMSETAIPRISQETLADLIGTTRSRVSFFMNKFRRLGFIEYRGAIKVDSSLLGSVLRDLD
jgi:CRP-like cAMP-binding protein